MRKKILLLPGDGIGPEVVNEGVKVLKEIGKKFNHEFEFVDGLIGAAAIDKTGNPLPDETVNNAKNVDSILLGAVGDPRFNDPSLKVRPEQGILKIRKELGLFANIRPMKVFDSLVDASPLKKDIVKGTDIIFYRELTGGIYFGEPRERRDNGNSAVDTCLYSKDEVRRITKKAFETANKRRKILTSVDKANVLETSRLWREVVDEVAKDFPEVKYEHQLVDSASMRLVKEPSVFDVILTENMFGDILTDEAAQIAGSMGLLASASIGDKYSLYEPAHGSAPDISGQNKANPIATLLSIKLMFEISFDMQEEANVLNNAISKVLDEGFRTLDIKDENTDPKRIAGTKEMGDLVCDRISS